MKTVFTLLFVSLLLNTAKAESASSLSSDIMTTCSFILSKASNGSFGQNNNFSATFAGVSEDQEAQCLEAINRAGANFDIRPYLSRAGHLWLEDFAFGGYLASYDFVEGSEDAMGRVSYQYDLSDLPTFQ